MNSDAFILVGFVIARQLVNVRAHSDPIHQMYSPYATYYRSIQQHIPGQLQGMQSEPPVLDASPQVSAVAGRELTDSSLRSSTAASQGSVQIESDLTLPSTSRKTVDNAVFPNMSQEPSIWLGYSVSSVSQRHRQPEHLMTAPVQRAHQKQCIGGTMFSDERTPPDNVWQQSSANFAATYYQSNNGLQNRDNDADWSTTQHLDILSSASQTHINPSHQQLAALLLHTANLNVGSANSTGALNPALTGYMSVASFNRRSAAPAAAAALTFSWATMNGGILADPLSQQNRSEESPMMGAYMHSSPVASH